MKLHINSNRIIGKRDPMIYGHFIENFHRQIYGGLYDPENPLSDSDGLRVDVINAMKKIQVPIIRWPGGCFVSAHHWEDAVGPKRTPTYDKAWRVEEPNTFGTDEFINFCKKVGCEPYICTNAGTGSSEEMSNWVEYCNLENMGKYSKYRIANGSEKPHNVKYWSIGNENYGDWEIGAKSANEWGRLVNESAKMINRVDPSVELSAAALDDIEWNINLLKSSGKRLKWISIHDYWDKIHNDNDYASYDQCMAFTNHLDDKVKKVEGILCALGLENKIRISFDEWNLRGWYHPNTHLIQQSNDPEVYLHPRDLNDDNSKYTMADAVFTASFLNMCLRYCNTVGMANFAPIVNTRGCIFTHDKGIILRSTYYVFDLFVNNLGDTVLDSFSNDMPTFEVVNKEGNIEIVEALDIVVTSKDDKKISISAINKDSKKAHPISLDFINRSKPKRFEIQTLSGKSTESYNDIEINDVFPKMIESTDFNNSEIEITPHSIN
ncbi:alpha-L-arabinofuranosidase C-terminal domain-containing protein, partial [Oceanispirochaeta sp.]|uniref:alpha-L-arabinofuranosidase C-terminal domain-containing protein n=1 Tax=Oceanispirochaeta sp. TaxID=2035350 RepID=UPI002623D530